MQKGLADEEIIDLLEDSFKKIESSAEQDSKKLSDFNNTLNWILTLSTVFFVFYTRLTFLSSSNWELFLSLLSKLFFILLTSILIVHKIFLIKYEDFKGAYLATLRSHCIDLKFNIEELKKKIKVTIPFSTLTFVNSFRNGDFLFHYSKDESIKGLKKFDRKIIWYGNGLKVTFWAGVVIFWLNFLVIVLILFK
ncbi:MAG TPA: hypothetical protein VK498_11120 [Ferruginibacter sp.]|nr:hypothetical protein [Ferruginibacter sp.]